MATYQKWLEDVMTAELGSAVIKVMLVTSSYVQSSTDHYRADIADEISGSGYTAGGLTATGVTLTPGTGTVTLSCDQIDFGALGATDIAGAIFYISTGSSATDRLLAADLFGPVDTSAISSYTYVPDPTGLMIAYAA
ncbi:hypothetical protein GCM10028801_30650 [Nocardioides maradonensis]